MFSQVARCHLATPQSHRVLRQFSSSSPRQIDYTHAVVGGGVVGLAVCRALSARPGTSTLLLERHSAVGTETSSRNSEVIHAGIYYGQGTLKTELCVRGRGLLYDFCRTRSVPHRQTGKWIVAQDETQREALGRIYEHAGRPGIGVPLRWVGREEARRREPDVRAEAGVLESPETGIVDSHALMLALQGEFEENGGDVALLSRVVSVEPLGGGRGWSLAVRSNDETTTITAETVINAAGLGAVDLHNMIVPSARHLRMFYAKGNYFSYGASRPRVGTLVYPAPPTWFGPDVEWVDSPNDLAVNSARLPEAIAEIKQYLPGVDEQALTPDYAGIRPKLGERGAVVSGSGFLDFVIRKEDGFEGWINLLGIESPGLTSSLAIAEEVERLLYR
ncbi:L-2-hydroxyglutarate dehydrogenase [Pyricularia oryzae 70-15]|uniref:L-2-hydroxyglutarate dehydrogenase, mitochondrial n=1 Tax=Pyricularia oryzae (strain 70-15 / ATCC MYA-4617 / FGSC 8958) TaxID=242507 RepID=G4NF64_PYRO7|nr:L-2-hydroxyglutarate dehydrogenase [Pyricularia oryzae 70-15]EHA47263.1 L-2-hydroxyglutarate dehydrogenase [Pyricularia oryzae 70-15]